MKTKRFFKIFLITLLSFTAVAVLARPGGGHSYSGGGSGGGFGSYGGGGFGGDAGLLYILFSVLPPEISVPLLIIFFAYIAFKNNNSSEKKLTFTSHEPNYYTNLNQFSNITRQIAQLRAKDPNFSRVLFLDFVSSLYNKFYAYQNDKKLLSSLNPFFDPGFFRQILNEKTAYNISEIVIGGMFIEKISVQDKTRIYVRIKSNMTIETGGKTFRYRVDERWLMERDSNILSPEPEKMHTVTCPACGAPADFNDSGYCKHCGTLILPGKMQWYVAERKVFELSLLKTDSLLSYAPETGTQLPTIYDPFLQQKISAFEQANNVNWQEYEQKFREKIVKTYFNAIYAAWSDLKWEKVRHLLSDRLWESYNFWIKMYKSKHLRNVLDVRITRIETAKIELDRFYEAITVRVFATGFDYVVDQRGRVVAGSKRSQRSFSEYWTFIRRSGVEKDDYDINTCPACGAPAENIGQSGICEYCGNKITWGDFSWVLAIVTQDEEYRG